MRKVDWGLAGLAILTLAIVGLLLVEDLRPAPAAPLLVIEERTLVSQGPVPAGDAVPVQLNWTLPAKATAAWVWVEVTFSGQAVQGGEATVSLRLTTPDGKVQPLRVASLLIAQAATSAMGNFSVEARWPESEGRADAQPLRLQVIAESPPDFALADYSFSITAGVTVETVHRP